METGIRMPRAADIAADDRRSFSANLTFYGVTEQRADLTVPAGCTCTLDTTPGAISAVPPWLLATRDLDRLKSWIGVPDSAFENARRPVPPVPAWLGAGTGAGPARNAADLAAAMTLARQAYVHGYSRLIERGKTPIEEYFDVFRVACVAIGRVVIEPGAVLVVQGSLPALLIVGELRLTAPGTLELRTETRMCVDHLVKKNDAEEVR